MVAQLKLGEVLAELRKTFPQDKPEVIRFFAAALINEDKREREKANSFLNKAIAAEAK